MWVLAILRGKNNENSNRQHFSCEILSQNNMGFGYFARKNA
jgi:hypothetical protein